MNAEIWTILSVGIALGGLIWRMNRSLRQDMEARFKQVDRQFAEVRAKFAEIDRRFEQVAECFREVRRQLAGLAEDLMRSPASCRSFGARSGGGSTSGPGPLPPLSDSQAPTRTERFGGRRLHDGRDATPLESWGEGPTLGIVRALAERECPAGNGIA